jgi:hypothetical protein
VEEKYSATRVKNIEETSEVDDGSTPTREKSSVGILKADEGSTLTREKKTAVTSEEEGGSTRIKVKSTAVISNADVVFTQIREKSIAVTSEVRKYSPIREKSTRETSSSGNHLRVEDQGVANSGTTTRPLYSSEHQPTKRRGEQERTEEISADARSCRIRVKNSLETSRHEDLRKVVEVLAENFGTITSHRFK